MSKSRPGNSAALKYDSTSFGSGYRNAVNDSTANKYTNTTNKSVSNMVAETFHDSIWRKRVKVKMACEEVIQMKNKKITVPCDSKRGISNAPCVSNRMKRGTSNVVTNPVTQVKFE